MLELMSLPKYSDEQKLVIKSLTFNSSEAKALSLLFHEEIHLQTPALLLGYF